MKDVLMFLVLMGRAVSEINKLKRKIAFIRKK